MTLAEPQAAHETRIHLCGRMTVRWNGRRIEDELPGKQGRQLFAWLVLNRRIPISRSHLLQVLWPESPPVATDSALAALLAKLRRVLGDAALLGRQDLQLFLPDTDPAVDYGPWVDADAAASALHRAQSAVAKQDWAGAWGPARAAMHITERVFMVGHDGPWIEHERRRLGNMYVNALECMAACGLAIGGAELATAERAARRLVAVAPLNEIGWRHLMEIVSERGNPSEALMLYEELRSILREQVGSSPAPKTKRLHQDILRGERP